MADVPEESEHESEEDEQPAPRKRDRIADEGPLDKREGDETSD